MTADEPNAQRAAGYAQVALAAATWATWPFVLRWSQRYGDVAPSMQAAIAMTVIGVLGAPFAIAGMRGRERRPLGLGAALGLALLGVGGAGNAFLYFAACQHASVAVAVLSHYLAPLLVAASAPLLLAERTTPRTLVAILIALAGLALLLRPWARPLDSDDARAAALGAGSAVFYASNVIVQKRLERDFSPTELLTVQGVVGGPMLLTLVPRTAWSATAPASFAVLLLGGVVPGFGAGLLFIMGLGRVPASHASTLTLLEPLVAVLGAIVFWDEWLDGPSALGAALVLVGAALVMRRAGKS
jgi:drug/metabolite transporter (DMT)-like permease